MQRLAAQASPKARWRARLMACSRHQSCNMVSAMSCTNDPVQRKAKSNRGYGSSTPAMSRRSSSKLMPPQNPNTPSTTHSLRCSRRQRLGNSSPSLPSGAYTRHCTPAARKRACHSAGTAPVPMPSTNKRTVTPLAAARSSASATANGAPTKSKM